MNSLFTKIVRMLLGLLLIAFGINKLMPSPFIPLPEMTDKASNFITSLTATGYVLKVVGLFEIFIGILLVLKKWVSFALLLLVPISINILLFHLFLDLSGISGALLIATMNGILIFKNWSKYKTLFTD